MRSTRYDSIIVHDNTNALVRNFGGYSNGTGESPSKANRSVHIANRNSSLPVVSLTGLEYQYNIAGRYLQVRLHKNVIHAYICMYIIRYEVLRILYKNDKHIYISSTVYQVTNRTRNWFSLELICTWGKRYSSMV